MRRTILCLVLTVLTVTVAPDVVGDNASAQSSGPNMTITPPCVSNTSGTIALRFFGYDFTDDATVRIYDEDKPNKPPILAGTNKSGEFTTQPISMPAKPAGYYSFRAEDEFGKRFTRHVQVPCPTIAINPGCGPAATGSTEFWDIQVTGKNFPPILPETDGNEVRFTFGGTPVGSPTEVAGNDGNSISTTLKVPRRASGSYELVAIDRRDGTQAKATFLVPCLVIGTGTTGTTRPVTDTTATTAPPPIVGPGPACVLDPPVGPPGFVTQARCERFPPGSTATLRWSPGIGVVTVPTGSGAFSIGVLIFPRDRLGPRNLIVEAPGASVPVPFIVVPPSVSPSGGDIATNFLPQLVRRY